MTSPTARMVAAGYDRLADAYLDRFGLSAVRQHWLNRLVAALPKKGSRVLDLGCGAGIPVARDLALLGHDVVGIDGSAEQIARARRNVPTANFTVADMTGIGFDAESFDAVCAFYSITHVPAADQPGLIARIARWLRPGGVFVASLGAGPAGDWTGEWLGTEMFFGHAGEAASLSQLRDAGFVLRESGVELQDNEDVAFLWIAAIKPQG